MTWSTSDVAVCCSSNSVRSSVRWRNSLSSRVVLDGDDGLGGKTRQQADLSFGEWANFLAIDRDHADQLIVLEHRHRDQAAHAGQFYEAAFPRVFVRGCFRRHVGDLDGALRLCHPCQHRRAGDRRQRLAASEFDEGGRRVVHRHRAAEIAFGEIQRAEIGLAKTRGAFQDDRKDPLQIARRRADQAQHLGCRGLLLQGLAQFLLDCARAALGGQRLRAAAIWVSQRRGACGRPPLGAANPLPCHQPCRAASSVPPRLQPAPIIRNGASRRHGDTVAAGSILMAIYRGFCGLRSDGCHNGRW